MNLPNSITLSRLVLTAICFVLLQFVSVGTLPDGKFVEPEYVLTWIAFWMFIIAAVTDFLDGYLARRLGLVTAFGRVIDPFADKMLICGSYVMLLRFPQLDAYIDHFFVVVVLARELLVTTLRGMAEAQGLAFPAERIGKLKMMAQCCMVGALLTMIDGVTIWVEVAVATYWIVLVLALWSCATYLYRARSVLFPK